MSIKERIVILQRISTFIDKLEEEKSQEESRIKNYTVEIKELDPNDLDYTWKREAIAESKVTITAISALIEKLDKIC